MTETSSEPAPGRETRSGYPGFVIRSAREADAPDLAALDARARHRAVSDGFGAAALLPPPDPERLAARIGEEGVFAPLLVPEGPGGEGRPVAYAIAFDAGSAFWLSDLAVDPDLYGRGLGSALLGAVVERARWAFHGALVATTWRAPSSVGRAFLEKRGFLAVERADLPEALVAAFDADVPPGTLPSTLIAMVRRL